MGVSLEDALRGAKHIGVVNLFRNRVRGGWQASVARASDDTRFSIGIDDDPVRALVKALAASAAGTPPVAPEPAPVAPPSRGIFG